MLIVSTAPGVKIWFFRVNLGPKPNGRVLVRAGDSTEIVGGKRAQMLSDTGPCGASREPLHWKKPGRGFLSLQA